MRKTHFCLQKTYNYTTSVDQLDTNPYGLFFSLYNKVQSTRTMKVSENMTEKTDICKDLRLYAAIYNRLIGENPTEKSIQWASKTCDHLLRGRWPGRDTTAHEIWIKRKDNSRLRLLIVTKKGHKQGMHDKDTGVLWIHGGGYAVGVPEIDFMSADTFCENDDAVLVMPDYRKSVEAPYPAALDDCMLALSWMNEHADILGINKKQLFVGGESAGGGLACAVTLRARDEGLIPIAFCMPLYPMISEKDTSSSEDNHMPVWNTAYNHLCWKLYRGDMKDTSPYFSPSEEKNYAGLPPHFSLVSDIEPFYTETRVYFDSLYYAGVPVLLKIYQGCFHAFDMTAPSARISKDAQEKERRVFHYAQKHFFA